MKTILKSLSVAFAVMFGTAAIFVLLFVSPRSTALKNQKEIIRLLYRAYPKLAPGGTNQIQSVNLADRITLLPGRTQVAFGYKLTVAIVPSSFTITADPLVGGETGVDSFFQDPTGKIRFEPDLGKTATARSRLFSR